MKAKRRRRSRSRSRNPVRRSSRRRSRNPVRRRRRSSRRMRNPSRIVNELFNPNMLTAAVGLTLGTVGTQVILNKLVMGNAAGQRAFNLPFVDFTVSGPAFWAKNKWPLLAYSTALPAVAGYFLRNQSPRLAQGLILSATFNAVSGAVKNLGVLQQFGVGRYLPAPGGTRAYTPGVPAIYTGPASAFIGGGVPQPRGTRAMVNGQFMARAEQAAPNPFNI